MDSRGHPVHVTSHCEQPWRDSPFNETGRHVAVRGVPTAHTAGNAATEMGSDSCEEDEVTAWQRAEVSM